MATSQIPGIYIDEVPMLPPSVTSVETALPAFIGYTQMAQLHEPGDLNNVPQKLSSILEYEQYFGLAFPESGITVSLDATLPANIQVTTSIKKQSPYVMYYAMQLFFANGGGDCYVISVGTYAIKPLIKVADLKKGLKVVAGIAEATLILFPDAAHVKTASGYYSIYAEAMLLCAKRKDRFTIMDVWVHPKITVDNISVLRNYNFGTTNVLSYAAVYYPMLFTSLIFKYDDASVKVKAKGDISLNGTLDQLATRNNIAYQLAKTAIGQIHILMPAANAAAGVYAQVDNARGVWKAPANINISLAVMPVKLITDIEQDGLSVDSATGKSINVIRSFAGRGNAIIWGARTLAGNDNEWRYVPVRRFFIMVETSIKNALAQFIFEPNEVATWVKVRGMIENYLTLQWQNGALAGAKTTDAFFVKIGEGETMTAQDILEGKMIAEIGMAVVRPAEFIILKIVQQMQQ
jgi:phage tail sheath protein FI